MNFRIDMLAIPMPLRKVRFKEIQELALSKGILWSSYRAAPYPVTRLDESTGISLFSIVAGGEWFGNKTIMMFSVNEEHPIINYRDAIKQLKEYNPDEKREIKPITVQDTYATTTATSYTIPSSVVGGAIFTTWDK